MAKSVARRKGKTSRFNKSVGYGWRILAWGNRGKEPIAVKHHPEDGVEFDELVIDDFLHIEKMTARGYWARIGDVAMWISKDNRGRVRVSIDRGQHGPERGWTRHYKPEGGGGSGPA